MPADPVEAGRKGGHSRSAKKVAAAKRNGFQPRPKAAPAPAELPCARPVLLVAPKDGSNEVSADPGLRLLQHNQLMPNPSRWTRGKGPWRIVYRCPFNSKTEALQAERFIKGMKSRAFIERLIGGEYDLRAVLEKRGENSAGCGPAT